MHLVSRVQTPEYVPKKPSGLFGVHPPKKNPQKTNPHFYFNLMQYFIVFKAF